MTLRSLFVDFNSYFASVEQQENPRLRGRPVGVVPVLTPSSCCIAASVEAKLRGVRTGTLAGEAKKLCPEIELVLSRPERYIAWHHRLLGAIGRVLPVGAVHSIDECDIELIGRERQRGNAVALAQQIKQEIARETDNGAIRCSIGIAPNVWLAKTASDMRKPDGLVVIERSDLPDVLHDLDLTDLCGISASMEARLHAVGIDTVAQLAAADQHTLRVAWGGIEGARMWAALRGDWQPARATVRGSVGHSHVLSPELRTPHGARAVLKKLLVKAAMRLRRYEMLAGALSVHIRYVGREERFDGGLAFDACDDSRTLLHHMELALGGRIRGLPGARGARPLAVSVTLHRLVERTLSSGSLFGDERRVHALNRVVDRINTRYGLNKVYFGGMHEALRQDAAPMRIPFNRIPDSESEAEHHDLWIVANNRARVLGEAEHRRIDQARRGRRP
ncbi:MAG: DNA polymerase [Proteobacteria bacterium]|nr:DNA polymerase [Pseudomonadota bacterium]